MSGKGRRNKSANEICEKIKMWCKKQGTILLKKKVCSLKKRRLERGDMEE